MIEVRREERRYRGDGEGGIERGKRGKRGRREERGERGVDYLLIHQIRVGAAADSLKQLEEAHHPPFDLIFIDADKINNTVCHF